MQFEEIIHLTTINIPSNKVKWRPEHILDELETTSTSLDA